MFFRLKLILLASSAAMAFSVVLILSDLNTHLVQSNGMFTQSIIPLNVISSPTISFNHDSSCHCPSCLGITTQFLS